MEINMIEQEKEEQFKVPDLLVIIMKFQKIPKIMKSSNF
jgi:hypothetical protein